MVELHSKALNRTISIDRIIGQYRGNSEGPTLIFTGGIHGNEPSGVFALQSVMDDLAELNIPFHGNLYALSGNLVALEKGVRYNQVDLNRIWTREKIESFSKNGSQIAPLEVDEQMDIFYTINSILSKEKGPFYFFDLHTTSGETTPFLTVNDSLLNRKFTKQYPLPIVLGIEEFLDGPLLSYINELGYVAFGFEAGQHDSPLAYQNQISFIYLSMVYTGCLAKTHATIFQHHKRLLRRSQVRSKFFEIVYHYPIGIEEEFQMDPGYVNFQRVTKYEPIAKSGDQMIEAQTDGQIFMPLYQGKGDDGFFIIKKIPIFFLAVSKLLRKTYFDRLLVLLPGVSWGSKNREELIVNVKVARFFTKQFFHLLGYRSKQVDKTHFKMRNREVASRNNDYKHASWR